MRRKGACDESCETFSCFDCEASSLVIKFVSFVNLVLFQLQHSHWHPRHQGDSQNPSEEHQRRVDERIRQVSVFVCLLLVHCVAMNNVAC